MKTIIGIALILMISGAAFAKETIMPEKKVVYKTIDNTELALHVFNPKGHKLTDKRPAIVFFFGGGWMEGNPKQFYQQAKSFAALGFVAMSAEYRVIGKHKTTPFEKKGHGFFNGSFFRPKNGDDDFSKCMNKSVEFLSALGFVRPQTPSKTAATTSTKPMRVVCVGDSITAGPYPEMLQKELSKGWVTVNCGKGAATVIEGTLRPYHKQPQYQKALASNPDIVIIMLGTNDANPKWWDDIKRETSFDGTPAEEFRTGYLALIDSFQKLPTQPRIIY